MVDFAGHVLLEQPAARQRGARLFRDGH
jgi:hypothetical protein